jgi:hypothetical protein
LVSLRGRKPLGIAVVGVRLKKWFGKNIVAAESVPRAMRRDGRIGW